MIYAIVVPITPPCFDQAVVTVTDDQFSFPIASLDNDHGDPEALAKVALKRTLGWSGNLDRLIYFGEEVFDDKTVHRFAYVCCPHEKLPDPKSGVQFYRKPTEKLLSSDVQMAPEHYGTLETTDSYMNKIRCRFERLVESNAKMAIQKIVAGESMALFIQAQDNWSRIRGGASRNGAKIIGRWCKHVVLVKKTMPPSSLSVVDLEGNTGVYQ